MIQKCSYKNLTTRPGVRSRAPVEAVVAFELFGHLPKDVNLRSANDQTGKRLI